MSTHSSILAWEIPGTDSLVGYSPWGRKKIRYDLATKQEKQQLSDKGPNRMERPSGSAQRDSTWRVPVLPL